MNLLHHLKLAQEEGTVSADSAQAGRPLPQFMETKQEELSGTIPWQSPNASRNEERKKSPKASHLHHMVEVAHHHHHLLLHNSPCGAPPLAGQMIYVDDCTGSTLRSGLDELHIQDRQLMDQAGLRNPPHLRDAAACRHRQRGASQEGEGEEAFNANLRRMITRAELHRLQRFQDQ